MKATIKSIFFLCAICSVELNAETQSELYYGQPVEDEKWEYYGQASVKANFVDAPVGEVVRALAVASGINFQIAEVNPGKITTQLTMNPFRALELIAERNGLFISKKDSIWFIGNHLRDELKPQTYSLSNVHLSALMQEARSQTSRDDLDIGMPQAGEQIRDITIPSFEISKNHIVEEVKRILNIQSGINPEFYASYEPDTNSLFVIGTEKQHQWVKDYLKMLDQEVPNVEIKIMFLSSLDSPQRQFGVDWSGMLNDGYKINVSGFDDKGNMTPIKWEGLKGVSLPGTAILSTDAFTLKLRALDQCSHTHTKKYPLVTTYSNREVILNFTKNEPVVTVTSDTQVQTSANNIGTGTTNTIEITQEQVGTVVRLLPRYIDGNKIIMNIDVGVSNILGFKVLKGNEYPVISQTRYCGQTMIESGYTVVVGGLEETISENSRRGVSFLKDVPFFGWLFKDMKKSESKQKLTLFISVRLLDAKGNEIKKADDKLPILLRDSIQAYNKEVLTIEKELMK